MRKLLIRLVICLAAIMGAGGAIAEQPSIVEQLNARLDAAHATLEDVERALADPSLNDAALKQLRERVDALPAELQDIIDKVTPRLAALEARLAELGGTKQAEEKKEAAPPPPPPEPPKTEPSKPEAKKTSARRGQAKVIQTKAGAGQTPPAVVEAPPPLPPADGASVAAATVNAEWAEQKKLFDEADATLKRARALSIEAKQTALAIRARQRALFAKTLFLRTNGYFSPSLWGAALRELPYDAKILQLFFEDRSGAVASRLRDGQFAGFLAIAFVILLLAWPAALLARRVSARSSEVLEPNPFQKAGAALWATLVTAAVPIAVVSAIALAVDAFDVGDTALEPLGRRLVEATAFVAVAYALARGVLAPRLAQWRLVDFGDRAARGLVRLAVAIGAIVATTHVLEQIAEYVQAGLPVVVMVRGTSALVIASLAAVAAFASRKKRETTEGGALGPARDWSGISRFFAAATLAAVLGALAAGYVAFANFVVLQLAWIATVGAALYLLLTFAQTGLDHAFQPATPLGRALTSGLGARRESLSQTAVLLTGVVTLCLYALAVFAILIPYGFQSGDVVANLRAAFFGFKIGDVTISPSSLVAAAALFAVTYGATRALRRWLDQRYLPLTRLDMGLRNSIGTSLGYVGFILAVSLALSELGLGLDKLAIVAGALSVGIGFGLQSIVNNFVSGLILLWERAIRVGDWVVVGDEQGYVKRINVRSTEIETFDRATMIVPNSNLVSGVVKNWLRNDRVGRVKIALAPHAGVEPETIRAILLAAAKEQEGVLRIPAPQVMFLAMEASAFRFELWCYVEDVEQSTRVKSDLHFDIHKRLSEAGVTIAPAPAKPPTAIVQIAGLEKFATTIQEKNGDEPQDRDAIRQEG